LALRRESLAEKSTKKGEGTKSRKTKTDHQLNIRLSSQRGKKETSKDGEGRLCSNHSVELNRTKAKEKTLEGKEIFKYVDMG